MADKRDLEVTEDFDLKIVDGDIKLSDEQQTIRQEINNRLKTANPDWFRHYIGADLEDLRGKKNKREVAELGLQKIEEALTKDEFLSDYDYEIRYVPTAVNEITYFINISLGYQEAITVTHTLELN